jgi:hypothetical protein
LRKQNAKASSMVGLVLKVLGTFLAVAAGAYAFVLVMMPFVFPAVLVGVAFALWRASRPVAAPARRAAKPAPARAPVQAGANVAIA